MSSLVLLLLNFQVREESKLRVLLDMAHRRLCWLKEYIQVIEKFERIIRLSDDIQFILDSSSKWLQGRQAD